MKKRVFTFNYVLKDASGQVLDSSETHHPMTFMEGAGQILPALEEEVMKLRVGGKASVILPAAKAYGLRNEELVFKTPPSKLPSKKVKIGDKFRGGSQTQPFIVTVTAVTDAEVTLDANHPLAGKDLHFDVELTEARDATQEEIAHGHAHGACHHQH
jgi:FKBP-type peptidyl-prolyl cis-trans isomerase SlyD